VNSQFVIAELLPQLYIAPPCSLDQLSLNEQFVIAELLPLLYIAPPESHPAELRVKVQFVIVGLLPG
jgi:hypothetical protein